MSIILFLFSTIRAKATRDVLCTAGTVPPNGRKRPFRAAVGTEIAVDILCATGAVPSRDRNGPFCTTIWAKATRNIFRTAGTIPTVGYGSGGLLKHR